MPRLNARELYDMLSEWDEFNDNHRLCSHCGRIMLEGFYLDGEYACTEECRRALIPDELYEEYTNDENIDESEYYWTEWGEDMSGTCFELLDCMASMDIDWRSDESVPMWLLDKALAWWEAENADCLY